jgi:hypothetical protein
MMLRYRVQRQWGRATRNRQCEALAGGGYPVSSRRPPVSKAQNFCSAGCRNSPKQSHGNRSNWPNLSITIDRKNRCYSDIPALNHRCPQTESS